LGNLQQCVNVKKVIELFPECKELTMIRISTVAILGGAACVAVSYVGFAQQPLGDNGLQQRGDRVEEGPVYPMQEFPASGVWKSEYDHKLDGKLRVQESTRIELSARNDEKVLTGNYQDQQAVGKPNDSVFGGKWIPGPTPVVTLTQTDDPAYTAIYTGKLVAPNRFVGTYMDNQGYSGDWSLELIPESQPEEQPGDSVKSQDEIR